MKGQCREHCGPPGGGYPSDKNTKKWLNKIENLFSTYPSTVRRSWKTMRARLLHRQLTDEHKSLSHLVTAAESRDKETENAKQPTDHQTVASTDPVDEAVLDEETEEQIYQGRLKQLTDSRNAPPLPALTVEERDILAWRQAIEAKDKGKDLRETKSKKRKKKTRNRNSTTTTSSSTSSSTRGRTHPVYFSSTDIQPASVMQIISKHKKWTYSKGKQAVDIKSKNGGWITEADLQEHERHQQALIQEADQDYQIDNQDSTAPQPPELRNHQEFEPRFTNATAIAEEIHQGERSSTSPPDQDTSPTTTSSSSSSLFAPRNTSAPLHNLSSLQQYQMAESYALSDHSDLTERLHALRYLSRYHYQITITELEAQARGGSLASAAAEALETMQQNPEWQTQDRSPPWTDLMYSTSTSSSSSISSSSTTSSSTSVACTYTPSSTTSSSSSTSISSSSTSTNSSALPPIIEVESRAERESRYAAAADEEAWGSTAEEFDSFSCWSDPVQDGTTAPVNDSWGEAQ